MSNHKLPEGLQYFIPGRYYKWVMPENDFWYNNIPYLATGETTITTNTGSMDTYHNYAFELLELEIDE